MSSNDEAEKAIKDFSKITGVDEALSHFFLQDFDFDLPKALNAYYREMENNKKKVEKSPSSSSSDDSDEIVELSSDSGDVETMDVSEPIPGSSKTSVNVTTSSKSDKLPKEITVLSWNVDGLDDDNLVTRFKGVLIIIAKVNPEIILLQEVVEGHMHQLNQLMGKMYHIIKPNDDIMPYFTVTLISKNIKCISKEIKPFSNTSMGRTMTIFEGIWQKLKIVVIHSHLESMKEHVNARKSQFKQCMRKIEEKMDKNTLVLFGGDLNIRDAEIGSFHPAIKDAWIAAGSKIDTKYTWDCKLNSNKGLPPNVRCRFDRIYYNGPYKKVDFSLHGTQQIRKIFCYPSDHFAIVATFKEAIDV